MLSILKPARVCLATLLVLVAQFALGVILNLYITVPPSDQHASFMQEVRTAPFLLTLHVVLGLALMAAAGLFVIRAVGMRDRIVTALAAGGLVAILGAFAAGEMFVRNGQTSSSLTMAVLTAAALACYITALGRLGAAAQSGEGEPARAALPVSEAPEDYLSLGYGEAPAGEHGPGRPAGEPR